MESVSPKQNFLFLNWIRTVLMDEQDDVGSKSLEKKLLDDRNVAMTGKMEEYLKGKEPIFVVVGAAHIIGDKGIAKQLRDKGYKVDQVVLEAK